MVVVVFFNVQLVTESISCFRQLDYMMYWWNRRTPYNIIIKKSRLETKTFKTYRTISLQVYL